MIRVAKTEDALQMLEIYAPHIESSAVSFELEVPGVEEFSKRITRVQEKYPWLVYEIEGQIAGYAYASSYRERKAYQWSVETTIYLRPSFFRIGIAEMLYKKLLHELVKLGYHNAYAIITIPNAASENFHEKMGFRTIGIFPDAGYKLKKWHDVKWMLFSLQESSQAEPAEPKIFTGL